jgi:DNA repair protein RecO (recombination protein O)
MGLVETEGLILKSFSLAEADKIVVFLSQHQGLVRGVAKGAKRLKSKFGGSLEPLTIAQITYFQKEERELVNISQIELVKSYFEIAADPDFLQRFAYIAELLIEFAPPHDPNETLYRMVKACLEAAAKKPQNLESVVLYFEVWLLRLGGYLPDWNRCENCRRAFNNTEKTNLQLNFQLHCQNCRVGSGKLIVSPDQREIYAAAQKISPDSFISLTAGKSETVKEISNLLKRIINGILGKDTISQKTLTATRNRL